MSSKKLLNRRKGPAVWGPRAQIDRILYKKAVQAELFATPNLDIHSSSVEDLLWEDVDANIDALEFSNRDGVLPLRQCNGVILDDGTTVRSKSVVITTGTFLRGQINIGLDVRPAGRHGDAAAIGLAVGLDKLGFRLSRLKTGTPPRIKKSSINFSQLEIQKGDSPPVPFSFMNEKVWIKDEDQVDFNLKGFCFPKRYHNSRFYYS